ncbi:DUF1488 domain-containing protein [Agarivorans sp. TSD2052]|uniref:DUF1488 domain-containing protein n=1 Tax=Agarivorans sp. TSD2052 TaxID=2937286 RepID=UPI00200F7F45|nr:DUF1488 domain-containing protein [Agarivorans sp. TSD2052]UPW18470.1 DUF1488 domain-containing protein [Agarivorans sp. TSD2052]
MNQTIIISDDQRWQAVNQRIEFSAQVMGAKVQCAVRKATLEHLVGLPLNNDDKMLEAYHSVQFDIEELLEQKLQQEDFEANGDIVV